MAHEITLEFGQLGKGEDLSDDNKFESQEQKLLNCQFEYANWQNPSNFNYALKNSTNSQERALMDFDKGTTTLAFRTAHGLDFFIAIFLYGILIYSLGDKIYVSRYYIWGCSIFYGILLKL